MSPIVLENGGTRLYIGMTHAQLLTTQQKLINDLMRYGYARVPETVNVKTDIPKGITINLIPKGSTFNVDDVVDISEVIDEEDPNDT
jgi:hypothetical protein